MKKEYCTECGKENLFNLEKPKFCVGCGQPFNQLSISASQGASSPTAKTASQIISRIVPRDVVSSPDLVDSNRQPLSELLGTSSGGPSIRRRPHNGKATATIEDLREEWANVARPVKEPKDIND